MEFETLLQKADAAWNREDVEGILATYAEDATLVVQPGLNVRGKAQIRKALEGIFAYFDHSLRVEQRDLTVIEGADTALVLARATIASSKGQQERKATYVFRKEPDGWRCAVDNSYGVDLL